MNKLFSIAEIDKYLEIYLKLTDRLKFKQKLLAERDKQIIINHIYSHIKEVTKWHSLQGSLKRNLLKYLWLMPKSSLKCKSKLLKNYIRKLRKVHYFPELRLRDLLFRRRIKIASLDPTLTVYRKECVKQIFLKESSNLSETLHQL